MALEQVAAGELELWTEHYGFGAMLHGACRPSAMGATDPVTVESRAIARLREADDPRLPVKELQARDLAERLLDTIDGCLQLRDTECHGRSGCDA